MARRGQRQGRVLEVLPDAERLELALISAAEGRGFADGRGFITFAQLAERLGDAASDARAASPIETQLLIWAAAVELGRGPFGAFVHEPAFCSAASELIAELKAAAVSPSAFAEAVETLPPGRRERARFLALLYASYERRRQAVKLVDREDRMRAAAQRLASGGLPRVLKDVAEVRVSGLFQFPPLRLEVLLALAQRCEREGIDFLLQVPAAGAPGLDAAVDPALAALERACRDFARVEIQKATPRDEERPLAALDRLLFAPGSEEGTFEALDAFSAATPRDEARAIALEVAKRLEAGAAPEEIAIALQEPAEDAPALIEELDALGIPARFRQGASATCSAAGRIALGLPLLVEDAFPAAEVAEILGGRYVPKVASAPLPRPAPLLALASVRDDRVGAEGHKGAYAVRLERLADRTAARDPHTARQIHELLSACRRLFELCARIPAEAPPAKMVGGWWAAVEALGISEAVSRPELRFGEEESPFDRARLAAAARDFEAAEVVRGIARELSRAVEISGCAHPWTRRLLHRWLAAAARELSLTPRGPRAGAVRILEPRELAGRELAHVHLAGLTDGRFPSRPAPHPLFSDEDRRAVNAAAGRTVFRLATGDADGRAPLSLAEDRLLFFLSLASTRGGATLSYPRSSGAQELLPSPFLDELRRVAALKVRHLPPLPVPPLDEVRSEASLRERAALEVLARADLRVTAPDPAAPALQASLGAEPWFADARALAAIDEERLRAFADPERPPTPFTGLVASPDLAEVLARVFRFGKDHPLSATHLDHFGNCAFQGFAAHVLRLDEREVAGEEIDPRGQGSFWHKVVEVLFPRLRDLGLLGRAPQDVPDAVLDEALAAGAEHAEKSNHVGHPAVWKLGRERARGMVRRLLSAEHRGLPFPAHVPEAVELYFGNDRAAEPWREVTIPALDGGPPIHVEGKIDRLDRGPEGALGIVDYKSGKVRADKGLKEKMLVADFQLPLYLYAARAAGHRGPMAAAWLSMRDADATGLEKAVGGVEELLSTDPAVQEQVAAAGGKNLPRAVAELVARLRSGNLAAAPHDCDHCGFRPVCRISERRVEEAA